MMLKMSICILKIGVSPEITDIGHYSRSADHEVTSKMLGCTFAQYKIASMKAWTSAWTREARLEARILARSNIRIGRGWKSEVQSHE